MTLPSAHAVFFVAHCNTWQNIPISSPLHLYNGCGINTSLFRCHPVYWRLIKGKRHYHSLCNDVLFDVTSVRNNKGIIACLQCDQLHWALRKKLIIPELPNINTFTAIVDFSRFNNSCLKSPASTLVDLTFQSRALLSFSLNQLRNLSL